MLIPVYIVAFILGGVLCFAIAQRVSNHPIKICLRTIGVVAGPIFFLVVAIFSSQEREKTYEMEWLTGKPAVKYYSHVYREIPHNPDAVVILKRDIGNNRECFSNLTSNEVAHYLESLPTQSVKVKYTVIYDFYRLRIFRLESVGDFPNDTMRMGIGGSGLADSPYVFEPCFPW